MASVSAAFPGDSKAQDFIPDGGLDSATGGIPFAVDSPVTQAK